MQTDSQKFTPAAKDAWRRMLFHKLSMWDACRELELALKRDCDSGHEYFDSLASGFGDAGNAWLADEYSLRRFVEECCTEEIDDYD